MGRGGHLLHHRDGEVVADVPGEEGWGGEGVQSGGEAPVVGGGRAPTARPHPAAPGCPRT